MNSQDEYRLRIFLKLAKMFGGNKIILPREEIRVAWKEVRSNIANDVGLTWDKENKLLYGNETKVTQNTMMMWRKKII